MSVIMVPLYGIVVLNISTSQDLQMVDVASRERKAGYFVNTYHIKLLALLKKERKKEKKKKKGRKKRKYRAILKRKKKR